MKRKMISWLCIAAMSCVLLVGCGANETKETTASGESQTQAQTADVKADTSAAETQEASQGQEAAAALADGTYNAEFDTDSSMFHVNEACEGIGVLTVENGEMTIHVSLVSKNIVNLFLGTAEDAQKDGAQLLQPTVDTVTYSDGISEEVYGFDIPVPVLEEEFDVAVIGTKDTWYDHKVSVSNPVAIGE